MTQVTGEQALTMKNDKSGNALMYLDSGSC